jgi:hypothetical protein
MKLIDYLKSQGAVSATLVNGPNGQFISATKADGTKFTLPVGKKSYNGKLADYTVLEVEAGVFVATVNNYETVETVTF